MKEFKIGDIVKCIKRDYSKEYVGKYFIIESISNGIKAPILETCSIDNRLPNKTAGLFAYKWEKVSKEEYIVAKLKGYINTKGVKYK